MNQYQYTVVYERRKAKWAATMPDFPGFEVMADSEAQVRALLQEEITAHIEELIACGYSAPEPRTKAGLVSVHLA